MTPSAPGAADSCATLAAYFAALAEPTRLLLLAQLRSGEQCVGELARRSGRPCATVSRHLAQLARQGIVVREARGASVYYRIADPAVPALCDAVCGALAREAERRAVFRGVAGAAAEAEPRRRRAATTSEPAAVAPAFPHAPRRDKRA